MYSLDKGRLSSRNFGLSFCRRESPGAYESLITNGMATALEWLL